MYKRRKKAPTLDVGKFTADSSIARADAVRLITMRIREFGDIEQQARNRVSKRVGYAIKTGKLSEISRGMFVLGNLARWAREQWPGKFDDLPTIYDSIAGGSVLCVRASLVEGRVVGLPSDLPQCHKAILRLDARIGELKTELDAARAEIRNLRPDADRWRSLQKKNRINAKRPRQPRRRF